MIYAFKGFVPVVHETSYVHPLAAVTGDVVIGAHVYVGPGAAIRGDWGSIRIADGCNIQENCTIHMFPGATCVLEEDAHIGHGAVIHGARIGRNAMIGMNSVVMDDAVIGAESIVGAMSFVKARMVIENRSLVVGNPAQVIKKVTDEMLAWKTKGTKLYQTLPRDMMQHMEAVEPLREVPLDRPSREVLFRTWEEIKGGK